MNRDYIKEILEERKMLHPDDPAIQKCWDKLVIELTKDEQETINYFSICTEDEINWLSEVFEDIAEVFRSKDFINFLKEIQRKYPDLDLESDIHYAELSIN